MSNRLTKNPVHPLDLNLNSLMVIYKKFEEAKRISGNPNQQLTIDLLVQLTSRLIGQQPSLLQKQLTKSLYKKTLSWNEFLNFLDHESEARESILDWIMYETNTREFKFYRQIAVKFLGHFDEITNYQPILIGDKPHTLVLLDKERFVLFNSATEQIVIQLKIKRQKQKFNEDEKTNEDRSNNGSMLPSNLKINSVTPSYIRKARRQQSNRVLGTQMCEESSLKQKSSFMRKSHGRGNSITLADEGTSIDDDSYILRERKKIGFVFEIFKQLPTEPSHELANFVSNKIDQRRLVDVNVTDLKDAYKDFLNKKRDHDDLMLDNDFQNKFAKAKAFHKRLIEDNRRLSYNPLKSNARPSTNPIGNRFQMEKKKINFEKKQRQTDLKVRALCFLQKHQLIAVALYNFQIVLLQISKEFNKIHMTQQDRIKVPKEPDRKKNEVIQRIIFHFHQIYQTYQILALIRVQNYSYIRCFNLKQDQLKALQEEGEQGKVEASWFSSPKKEVLKGKSFSLSKQVFNICLNFQAVNMVDEIEFGFHIVGFNGSFRSYKDDLTPTNQYYTLHASQKFKGDMVFSCMSISKINKKIMFGTVGGSVCFYDIFSKQMVLCKKVSSKSIIQVLFDDVYSQALAFSADEIVTVFDTHKLTQLQVLNAKNQDRLNEKATMFSLSYQKGQSILSVYGSQFRQFISRVDDDKNNRRRKVESTYRWRQKKINEGFDQQFTSPLTGFKSTEQLKEIRQTDKYFVTMSNQLELKLYSRKSYKVKFSLILNLTEEEALISFNVSRDAKILVYSTQDQRIRIVNIYTEEVYQVLNIQQKITHFQFLSQRNEYFLVTGSQCGKISFIPSYLCQGKLPNKILQVHKKHILTMATVSEYLITTSEEGLIVVWQLPFNVIRFQINIADHRRPRQCIVDISPTNNFKRVICRGTSGVIYQLDSKEGVFKDAHQQLTMVNILTTCFNQNTRELFVIDEDLKLTIYDELLEDLNSPHPLMRAKSYVPTDKNPSFRRAITKAPNRGSMSPTKRKTDSSHQAQIPSKWKIKSTHIIPQKQIEFAKIIPNHLVNTTGLFLSKDCFYIYDHSEDRLRGKYSYSNGCFYKNDPKMAASSKPATARK